MADQSRLEAVDEIPAADGDVVTFGRTAVEGLALVIAGVVDVDDIPFLDRAFRDDLIGGSGIELGPDCLLHVLFGHFGFFHRDLEAGILPQPDVFGQVIGGIGTGIAVAAGIGVRIAAAGHPPEAGNREQGAYGT